MICKHGEELPTSYTVSGCVRSRQPSLRNGGQEGQDGHDGHDGQDSQDSQDGQDGHDSHGCNKRFFIIAQVKSTSLDLNI